MDVSNFPFAEVLAQAARERRKVKLTYPEHGEGGGTQRTVEPYSYRVKGKEGNTLFFGFEQEAGSIKGYRLDKIEGVELTEETYEPKWPVEIG